MSHVAKVLGVGGYVPPKVVTNTDLEQMMDTSDEWIRTRTGIEQRRFAGSDVGTSDLATKACEVALERAGTRASDVDLILAATLTPDYYFPGIGPLIQRKLGLGSIPAVDIRGQCSGFSWAISHADAFIKSGTYKKILVVGAEIHSRILELTTEGRNVSVLFGDGAGAVLFSAEESATRPSPKNDVRGVIDNHMGCDGSGAEHLAMLRPGSAEGTDKFVTYEDLKSKRCYPVMDGQFVFKNAVNRMTETAKILCERQGIPMSEIDLLVPHQANLRINDMVRSRLGLSEDRVFNNIQKYGNTTAATLPLVMQDAEAAGKLKPGMLVMTLAFGSGFCWGGNLIRW